MVKDERYKVDISHKANMIYIPDDFVDKKKVVMLFNAIIDSMSEREYKRFIKHIVIDEL